jgi:hypothetical protein
MIKIKLQSTLDSLAIKQSDVNLEDKSNKNAYALGVFYLTQALSDVNKMADNDVKLTPSALVSGFNDAYNKKLRMKKTKLKASSTCLTKNYRLSTLILKKESWLKSKTKNMRFCLMASIL